jgi:hypothetical protein
METPSLEPWLADLVEASIAPYRDRLSGADLVFMREQLVARLREDPALAQLARDARPRAPVDDSGKILRRDVLEGGADDDVTPGIPRAVGGRRQR